MIEYTFLHNPTPAELTRLIALKQSNPHIKDDELTTRYREMEELADALAQAKIRLDALRLILVMPEQ